MCGIVGQYNFHSSEPVKRELISGMMQVIEHRGPDDHGIHINGNLGLGFQRLAIIDLTETGHQPMCDSNQKVWVVFNGEIYNFRQLRQELSSLGYQFRGSSDTEVIVNGYLAWGEKVLNRLKGMFGLAIWDQSVKRLLLARDPMGIKPVYYLNEDGQLFFASEIKALLTTMRSTPAVDAVALNMFLRYRYCPAPYTLHEGILKLAAGEALKVEDGQITKYRYYDHKPKLLDDSPNDHEAQMKLLDLYKEAMERHLISDVPVGLLLSGGIDSGLLLGLMNLYGKNWPTFTVGYGKQHADDELDDAADTAAIFGAQHHSVLINQAMFEEALPKIVNTLEEPIASSSIVPMYFICQRARQDVKVALIGQGPDELFGGYSRHMGVHYGSYWRRMPASLRKLVGKTVMSISPKESWRRGFESLDQHNELKRFRDVFSLMPGHAVDRLFKAQTLSMDPGERVLRCWHPIAQQMSNLDELGRFQLLELRSSLPDELLLYSDKMSMAHSLELRVPFLDQDVVEYAQSLAARFKVRGRCTKWLHRNLCKDFLPDAIINRKKRGFAVKVVQSWIKSSTDGKLNHYLEDPQSLMYQYLEQSEVLKLKQAHVQGHGDHHKLLFSLVVFEEWLRYPMVEVGKAYANVT